ncbi:MAG: DUF4935 domain-containing protein [Gemmatimonadales bacterium]|nr:DUF4935 domain-containing protein [Gemmatimonadales bacterium]
MHLFIDTNILLSFYHLSGDDLEELRKLLVLLDKRRVTLLITEQVEDEFRRNRDVKIADALKRLRDVKLNPQFPQMAKDYSEYGDLRKLQRDFERLQQALLDRLGSDIKAQSLKADELIEDLFQKATCLPRDAALLARARLRQDVGNPPGKEGSLGDAINWESLLEHVPDDQDLHLVTDDRDFASALDDESLHPFLGTEWDRTRTSHIYFYKRLSDFFRRHFAHIRLAHELEKDLLISDLAASGTFAQTHATIAKLASFADFTATQADAIALAAASNNQVYWIATDSDVFSVLSDVATRYASQIDPHHLRLLLDLLNQPPTSDEPAGEPLF